MTESLNALRERARHLALLATDVDGVLTDGRLWYGPDGEVMKAFHILDGHGLKMLGRAGITVALITGRDSPMVTRRAQELGIGHVIQGREDKGVALQALAAELGLAAEAVGYVGDDLPDVPALEWAGLAFSVPNAHPRVRAVADLVTDTPGGQGAIREICDFILDARAENPAW